MSATDLHANPWTVSAVEIRDIVDEIPGIATYRLEFVAGSDTVGGAASYAFVPGQFNMLYLPGVGEAAISMSGSPHGADSWIHTVRVAGGVTKTLAGLEVGDQLGLRGPFGTGWPVETLRGGDLVIVAGGVGLAPVRPLVYDVIARRGHYGRVWVICGARTPDTLLYPTEFAAWRAHDIDVRCTVDRATDGWTGHVGVVTLLVDRLRLPAPERTHMVACGPEVMMKYAAVSGAKRGIAPERTWISLERNMQCAAGLCGHCQLGPAFVCKDGPVFRYDRIRPYLFVEGL